MGIIVLNKSLFAAAAAVLSGVALLGGASVTQAASSSETLPFSYQATHSGTETFSHILTFGGFNAALGTLEGVAVQLSNGAGTELSLTIALTGGATNLNQLIGDASGTYALSFFGGSLAGQAAVATTCMVLVDGAGCSDTATVPASGFVGNPFVFVSSDPGFSQFGSAFDVTLDGAIDEFMLVPTANGSTIPATPSGDAVLTWAGEVTVTYSFTPADASDVPEPTSLALFGTAIALAALRRRR